MNTLRDLLPLDLTVWINIALPWCWRFNFRVPPSLPSRLSVRHGPRIWSISDNTEIISNIRRPLAIIPFSLPFPDTLSLSLMARYEFMSTCITYAPTGMTNEYLASRRITWYHAISITTIYIADRSLCQINDISGSVSIEHVGIRERNIPRARLEMAHYDDDFPTIYLVDLPYVCTFMLFRE